MMIFDSKEVHLRMVEGTVLSFWSNNPKIVNLSMRYLTNYEIRHENVRARSNPIGEVFFQISDAEFKAVEMDKTYN